MDRDVELGSVPEERDGSCRHEHDGGGQPKMPDPDVQEYVSLRPDIHGK
jgi:hypothetical protein